MQVSIIYIFFHHLCCMCSYFSNCMYVHAFSDCYVADELVVSRAGRRVRVGNTDAEGRMVMVDLLCEMKEKVRTSHSSYFSHNRYSMTYHNLWMDVNLHLRSIQSLSILLIHARLWGGWSPTFLLRGEGLT